MNDIIIQVENLGKMYRIGAKQAHYQTLRDTLAQAITSPFRRLSAVVRGQPAVSSSQMIWALKNVSFEVKQGEVVGIIGRNGAGKSTLLKILSRITEPTEGHARLYGRIGSLLEVGTGFHPELTGRENIYLSGAILGMKKAEIDRQFDEIVAFAEIDQFVDTPVKRYSSGMHVRLAFAVAAHLEPEILLVDEVLAVGDFAFQKKCLGKMEDVAQSGRTVLFVSHQMAAIQNLCRRTILLNQGAVVTEGKTEAVIEQYMAYAAEDTQTSLANRKDRQGTGAIQFISVKLQNQDGKPVKSIRCGKPATLVICYKNHLKKDLKNLHLSIGIDSPTGQRIALLNNEISSDLFAYVPAYNKEIHIHIDRVPLMPGRYGYTLYCTLNGVITDWIQNAGYFDVEAGDYYNTGKLPPATQGNFLIDHQFHLEKKDKARF